MKVAGTLAVLAAGLSTVVANTADIQEAQTVILTQVANISTAVGDLRDGLLEIEQANELALTVPLSTAVVDTIDYALNQIAPVADLDLPAATNLQPAIFGLQQLVNSTVNALIAPKLRDLLSNNSALAQIALDQIGTQRQYSEALSNMIISKVPEDLNAVARQLSDPIIAILDNGISIYEDLSGEEYSPTETPSATVPDNAGPTAAVAQGALAFAAFVAAAGLL